MEIFAHVVEATLVKTKQYSLQGCIYDPIKHL